MGVTLGDGVCLIIVFTQAAKMADQWQKEIICTRSIIPTLNYNVILNINIHKSEIIIQNRYEYFEIYKHFSMWLHCIADLPIEVIFDYYSLG